MPVYKRKDTKSKRFYFKFDVDGVTYKKNISTARTKRQAEDAERQARQEVHEGRYSTQKPTLFTDFVKGHYLPWAEKHHAENDVDKTQTDLLCGYFKSYTVGQISPMSIEGFMLKLSKTPTQYGTPYAPASINLAVSHLSGMMNMAVRYRLRKDNPCKGIKRMPNPHSKVRYLFPEEESALLPTLKPWLRDLVQLAIWTGFRQNELIELRKSNVDFQRGLIVVVNPKWKRDPRKTEGFPMGHDVRELALQLCGASNDYLFTRRGKKLTKSAVDQSFRSACRAIGIYDLNFHALRHTFGTRLGDRDVNLKKIARLMGHATTKHTEIYVHTTDLGLSEAVEIATESARNRTSRVELKRASSL